MADRVLIACNSALPSRQIVLELVEWADLVLGADSGADRLLAVGVEPDLALGDLDSLSATARKRLGGDRVVRVVDPDTTDLDKCLAHAVASGAGHIRIIGATADRLDHIVASMASLLRIPKEIDARLVDDRFETSVVHGRALFEAPKGTVVSLLAPGGAQGVTTQGLRWPLASAELPFSSLGVHNTVESSPVEISVSSGDLFLLKGRFVEPHD